MLLLFKFGVLEAKLSTCKVVECAVFSLHPSFLFDLLPYEIFLGDYSAARQVLKLEWEVWEDLYGVEVDFPLVAHPQSPGRVVWHNATRIRVDHDVVVITVLGDPSHRFLKVFRKEEDRPLSSQKRTCWSRII